MAAVKPRVEARSTKAERSAATRARLLDATIDCLVELGWSGTSTTEVVRRAGVSRGAQVHHYPSKEDLVLAALQHLQARRLDEYRAAFQGLPAQRRTPGAAFDLLRSVCSGPTFEAWLELAVAARTHPVLRACFVEADRQFWAAAVALYEEIFPESAADPTFTRLALRFSFSLVDGLAVGQLIGADPAELDAVAQAFKDLTAPFLSSDPGAQP